MSRTRRLGLTPGHRPPAERRTSAAQPRDRAARPPLPPKPAPSDPAYTRSAVKAIARAAGAEHYFSGWLADVLARVAAIKGSSDALTAGRPGSWEASLVGQLVKGTVGYDDVYLS
jgi:hypothetical protein